MNKILNYIIEKRKGFYIHAIEVKNVYEIENVIESMHYEFVNKGYQVEDLKDFFNTITIYFIEDEEVEEHINEHNENLVYNFNFNEFINELNN